jgi:hypothetical protein
MPALVAGIHGLGPIQQDVDGRDKPGHDGRLGANNKSDRAVRAEEVSACGAA